MQISWINYGLWVRARGFVVSKGFVYFWVNFIVVFFSWLYSICETSYTTRKMPIFDVFSPKMRISTLRFFYTKRAVAISLKFRYMFNQLSKKIPRNFYPILTSHFSARFFWKKFPNMTMSILAQKGVNFCTLYRGRVPSLINIFSIWFLHLVASIVELLCIHGTWDLGAVVLELLTIQNKGEVCHLYFAAKCASHEGHAS